MEQATQGTQLKCLDHLDENDGVLIRSQKVAIIAAQSIFVELAPTSHEAEVVVSMGAYRHRLVAEDRLNKHANSLDKYGRSASHVDIMVFASRARIRKRTRLSKGRTNGV